MFGLKREIEEKTPEYRQRMEKERSERQATREANTAKVLAEVLAAEPTRLKGFREADRKAHAAWKFSCKVSADFIVLRWTDRNGTHSHALNLKSVSDIKMESGSPVRTTGTPVYHSRGHWYYGFRDLYGYGFYGDVDDYYSPLDGSFSTAASLATITFLGVGFQISVPHRKADDAYSAIMSAIEGASPRISDVQIKGAA